MAKPRLKDFRSKFEYSVASDLWKRKIAFGYEVESFPFFLEMYRGECRECGSKDVVSSRSYTPDFFLPGGVVVEAKGKFTPKNRTRMLAFKESNPGVDIRMLFMRNNWISSKKRSTYGDWCDKHGFPWSVGTVPKDWIK